MCTQFLICAEQGHLTVNSETNEDIRVDKFISPTNNADGVSPNRLSVKTQDRKHATDGLDNGYLNPKSSKADKWRNGELGRFKGNEKLKGDFDTLEADVRKTHFHRRLFHRL